MTGRCTSWKRLQPLLPGGAGKRGRPARDNRLFVNAVVESGFLEFKQWREWLMIDASYIKAHPCRRPGREPSHRPHKRGLNSKLHTWPVACR